MAKLPRQQTMSKDPKLQDDIEKNLKLRDGASRILAMAGNSIQRLDAAKTILVSNARLVAAMQQLQREKTKEAIGTAPTSQTPHRRFGTGKATLCLSGLRIPLLWKETSLTPNSTATLNQLLCPVASTPGSAAVTSPFTPQASYVSAGGYSSATLSRPRSGAISMAGVEALVCGSGETCSAFCMVHVGDQIRETKLLCDVLPGSADLEFDDVLAFNDVESHFECTIEVYGYQPTSAPNGNTFLRRTSANRNSVFLGTLTPEYSTEARTGQKTNLPTGSAVGCCFSLVARYSARLGDISSAVDAHPLELVSAASHYESLFAHQPGEQSPSLLPLLSSGAAISAMHDEKILPLFGPICFQLTARPDSVVKPVRRGMLWMRILNVSPEQDMARLYSCELRNQRLYARFAEPRENSTPVKPAEHESSSFSSSSSPSKCSRRLDHSGSVASRNTENNWDLVLKIDRSTDLIDSNPITRKILLSPEYYQSDAATKIGEREHARPSPLPRLPRKSASVGHINSLNDDRVISDEDGRTPLPLDRQLSFGSEIMATTSYTRPRLLTRGIERELPTLRLVCKLDEGGTEVTSKGEEIVEVASFDPFDVANEGGAEHADNLNDWLLAFREHVEEQAEWGASVFGHEVNIPEATSFTKHGTIIRALTIPEAPCPPLTESDSFIIPGEVL